MAWIFRDFVNDRGDNEIRQWLDSLPKAVRFKIDARLRYLQNVGQLKFPYVEKWVGEDDLYEVRVVFSGDQYRSIGCYGPARRDFTLLIGAVEKGGKLEPRQAVSIAKARMALIHRKEYTCEHFG
jgi:hypothetical protein